MARYLYSSLLKIPPVIVSPSYLVSSSCRHCQRRSREFLSRRVQNLYAYNAFSPRHKHETITIEEGGSDTILWTDS